MRLPMAAIFSLQVASALSKCFQSFVDNLKDYDVASPLGAA
jgi:hypothetical protein